MRIFDKDVAKYFEKEQATLSRWKKKYPKLYQAMRYYYENVVIKESK